MLPGVCVSHKIRGIHDYQLMSDSSSSTTSSSPHGGNNSSNDGGNGNRRRKKSQLSQICVITKTDLNGTRKATTHNSGEIIVDKVILCGNNEVDNEESRTRKSEIQNGQNKLSRLFQTPETVQNNINRRIGDGLRDSKLSVNIKAFTVVNRKCRDYDTSKSGGMYYEAIHSDSCATIITKDQLFLDVMNFYWRYLDLLHICNYLERMTTPLHYLIYKREIHLVDETPLHDNSSFIDQFIMPKRVGFYYAIIVNFGLTIYS